MDAEARKERYIDFLKVVTDADAELLQQISHWMHTNLLTYGVELPFEVHCKSCKAAIEHPVKNSLAAAMGASVEETVPITAKKVVTGGVKKSKLPNFVDVLSAPQVKSKAYNSIALHIPKGGTVMLSGGAIGVATGFTKYFVKFKNNITGVEGKVTYSKVTHVAV